MFMLFDHFNIKTNNLKKKNKIKQKTVNMGTFFVLISCLSILVTIIFVFFSHGDLFPKIFFEDSLDTGMDFFHSIEYVKGRVPYEKYSTLYPPFANFCFYILFLFTPYWQHDQWENTFELGIAARGTAIDLRVWQPTMFMFIIFILTSAICLIILMQKILFCFNNKNLIIICCLFSYGILWAFERGNIIIISFICCLFFVTYKDSNNKIIAETALIMLAVSAGLKIYPAIFGMLLIYDKQYKKAFRAVIYGVLFFVLPFFAFKERLSGLPIFLKNVVSFKGLNITINAFTVERAIKEFLLYLDVSFDENLLTNTIFLLKIVIIIIIVSCGFFVQKKWQHALICCLAFYLIQAPIGYNLIFYIIPFLYMLVEEKDFSIQNIIPFSALVLTQLLLPIWDSENTLFSIISIRFQLCTYILCVYIMHVFINVLYSNRKTKKLKFR